MASFWISEADSEAAKELYADQADPQTGRTQAIVRVQGHHPDVASAHRALYHALMFEGSGLARRERETLALFVSAINGCDY